MIKPFFDDAHRNWHHRQDIANRKFICGYCNQCVSVDKGFKLGHQSDGSGLQVGGIYICSNCHGPTFFNETGERYPTPALGNQVDKVPDDLNALYEEARRCTSQNCNTAAVLLCRNMLMSIAVVQGAKEGMQFIEYVSYLSDKGFTPPNGKHWVDHIRKKGNEATHEIAIMKEQDAKDLLTFTEMLLRFIYEFPSMVPQPKKLDS